ncbi:MAG: hypothetical protein ABJE10_23900 [bacterium]
MVLLLLADAIRALLSVRQFGRLISAPAMIWWPVPFVRLYWPRNGGEYRNPPLLNRYFSVLQRDGVASAIGAIITSRSDDTSHLVTAAFSAPRDVPTLLHTALAPPFHPIRVARHNVAYRRRSVVPTLLEHTMVVLVYGATLQAR